MLRLNGIFHNAVRPELSWTHYRVLMKVKDEEAGNFYLEGVVKAG